MFKLGQMNVFIEASLIVVTLPVWQFCLFIINLCCKSSPWCPEQYMQLALACMCAQVDTSCYVTPVCGMFAFSDTIYRLLCLTTGCYEYMHEWPWKCLSMLWASFACRPRSVYSNFPKCPCTPDRGMFAFGGLITLCTSDHWCCLARMNDKLRMFKHPLSLFVSFVSANLGSL